MLAVGLCDDVALKRQQRRQRRVVRRLQGRLQRQQIVIHMQALTVSLDQLLRPPAATEHQ